MQLRTKKPAPTCRINIAPLIDVVFLLIIFFMTVTQLTQIKVDKLALPEVAEADPAFSSEPLRLVVNIHNDGRMVIDSQAYTTMSFDGLLAEKLQNHEASQITILIRGDRQTPWRNVAAVMNICSSRGISNVKVAVRESGGQGVEL